MAKVSANMPRLVDFANGSETGKLAKLGSYTLIKGTALGEIRTTSTATGALLYSVPDAIRYAAKLAEAKAAKAGTATV